MSEYITPLNFIDLKAQQDLIREELDLAISRVLDHGTFIMGPEVLDFESILKKFTGAKYALSCANGTDALSLVLMAWDVGPGDAIFVPSFTYVSTAEAPAQLGATPFFVDVCSDTFNIDPKSFKQAVLDSRNMGLKPRVVIPVDLFGQPAEIDSITEIAEEEDIKVLIDAAQSFGGMSKGRRVGSMGDATTTSFFPAKPLGCYGDGGAIFTNNDEDAEIINSIRLHGKGSQKYDNIRVGLNSRLDTIQAAILIEKMKIFPQELSLRSDIANKYSNLLSSVCDVPSLIPHNQSAWAQYTIKSEYRDDLQKSLKVKGVPTIVYYPIPLSKQIGYQHHPSVSCGLEKSEILSKTVLSLPMHPYLNEKDMSHICSEIVTHFSK